MGFEPFASRSRTVRQAPWPGDSLRCVFLLPVEIGAYSADHPVLHRDVLEGAVSGGSEMAPLGFLVTPRNGGIRKKPRHGRVVISPGKAMSDNIKAWLCRDWLTRDASRHFRLKRHFVFKRVVVGYGIAGRAFHSDKTMMFRRILEKGPSACRGYLFSPLGSPDEEIPSLWQLTDLRFVQAEPEKRLSFAIVSALAFWKRSRS